MVDELRSLIQVVFQWLIGIKDCHLWQGLLKSKILIQGRAHWNQTLSFMAGLTGIKDSFMAGLTGIKDRAQLADLFADILIPDSAEVIYVHVC